MIDTTICLPMLGKPPNQVLLALKKRGFGMGKITGVGGKIEAGETAAYSALRELAEEIGITVALSDLHARGVIEFFFPFKPSWNMRSYLFVVEAWQGFPSESDEVAPHFYPFDQIPFERMWSDARHWLPLLLQNRSIRARFVFGEDNETITELNVEIIFSIQKEQPC